jgi:16S rRNA processing protein RimM
LSDAGRQLLAGRVGRPHGLDGSFHVERAGHELAEGTSLTVAGRTAVVERRAGTDQRPLVRLSGVVGREAAEALRGEELLVAGTGGDLAEDEWLTVDLVGCRIEGIGEVRRVIEGPSCDVLEVGEDAVLVPFVSDAIKRVDTDARVIEVDRVFLALDE